MLDLRDAFRITADAVAPAPGALDRQLQRQRRRSGRRKAGAFVAVAAVLTLVAGVILATRPGGSGDDEEDRLANPAPAPHGLFALDVATGERSPFHDPGEGTHSFRMSPDGTKLLMTWEGDGEWQLWVSDPDGTHADVLVDEDARGGSWFPDSARIAYAGLGDDDTRQVQLLDTNTGARETLTDEASDVYDVTVSADGETIVYVTTHPGRGGHDQEGGDFMPDVPPISLVRSLDLGSGEIRTLFQQRGGLYSPSISPVDGRIAFELASGKTTADMVSQIWLMNADGSEAHPIVDAAAEGVQFVFLPQWSADGSTISYGYDDNVTITTWIYDVTTGGSLPIGRGLPAGWLDADTLLVGT